MISKMRERSLAMTYTAEEVYESFQNSQDCRTLVRMLLNSGLLAEILAECSEYIADEEYQTSMKGE